VNFAIEQLTAFEVFTAVTVGVLIVYITVMELIKKWEI